MLSTDGEPVNGNSANGDVVNGNPANGDATNGKHVDQQFTLKDETVENQRPLKVIVVGAGFSGILAAIRIPEKLRNVELVVYEKNEGVGGVWWMNKYPGLACDIPSHSYQYTFAPNARWTNLYAPGREIQQYLQGVADRFGATRFIKTSRKVESCEWDPKEKQWTVRVTKTDTGETFEDKAHFVIAARGQLNQVNWPDIPGLDKFQGKLLHSAEWDEEYDFRNKRVGVIGNGSSAIQIIPNLQKIEGVKLTCFMRSPTWISPAFGDASMIKMGLDPKKTGFTEEQREAFFNDPDYYLKTRKVIEDDGNLIHDSTIRGTEMHRTFMESYKAHMTAKLGAKRPELLKTLIPSFSPGCRRLTPGTGFLEALCEDNVEVLTAAGGNDDRIATVTETGVRLASGREIELDALACATGFRVSAPPDFAVVGRDGQTLAQRWTPYPESYLSVAVDGFPNYLMMFGPNSAIGFGSLTKILEAEIDYIVKVLRKMQREDYATIEPKKERVADFSEYTDVYFRNTVYTEKCKSWYRSEAGYGDRIIGLWPGSTLHALEVLRSPRWEDFVYESADPSPNALRWLGNGWSITQKGGGDPSWYLNPEEVEVPMEKRPEDNPRYNKRPWSY
ncbi:hypothetical protein VTK73DRAFT_9174 [Phialemonium thermophilum]|uniref:Uncharacterized protein n=1 Tax=Phialemonium thermophilum TaxID=223376 RepID=A0ABR3W4K8_9PEZI